MTQYPLDDKQKELLRSIAPGLRDGTVETDWIIVRGDNRIMEIFGLDDESRELWLNAKDGVGEGDLEAFIRSGLFSIRRNDKYGWPHNLILNRQLILNAVENDFAVDDWFTRDRPVQNINVQADGSIVNINSTLNNVSQIVQSSATLPEGDKEKLAALVEALQDALRNIAQTQPEEADAIAHYAQEVVSEAASEKPNKVKLEISGEGLIKAAKTIAVVAPAVLTAAKHIVDFIQLLK